MATHADLIMAAIRAAVPAGVTGYDSLVPGVPTARYVVGYFPVGLRSVTGIDAVSDHLYFSFQTTSVASDANPANSAALCRWLAILVRETLTDLVITADGYAPAQILHQGSQPAQPDEQTPDKKVYAVDQFGLNTVRLS